MDYKIRPLKKLVKWLISRFYYEQLLFISSILFDALIFNKDKHKFKIKLPQEYRKFRTDKLAPLIIDKPIQENYLIIISNNNIKPVKSKNSVPINISCPHCSAPANYLYYNNGIKKSQIKCKCCNKTFSTKLPKIIENKKFHCPYCSKKLSVWKRKKSYISYKCMNDNCSHKTKYLKNLSKEAKKMYNENHSNFHPRYNHKQYFYDYNSLSTAKAFDHNIKNIHNPEIIGKIFTLRVTYGLSLRNTKAILYDFFNITISHQTILNYINMFAYPLQNFNNEYSKLNSLFASVDETYIKENGVRLYQYFAIDGINKNIFASHLSYDREFKSVNEFFHDVCKNSNMKKFNFITDGLPTYQAVINQSKVDETLTNINHIEVVGLKNKDEVSKIYRAYKQIIERLNETYKYFYKIQRSFKTFRGALNYTTAFITNYNFIRPHSSLNNKPPVELHFLKHIDKTPDKWIEIINRAIKLN